MAITFSTISSQVDKSFKRLIPKPDRALTGYEFVGSSTASLREDHLYVGYTSELIPSQLAFNSNLLLFEDEKIDPKVLENNRTNILISSSAETFSEILDMVRKVFDYQMEMNNFGYDCLMILQRGESIKSLLNHGYEMLGNPIVLLDTSLTLIEQVGVDLIDDEKLFEDMLKNGYISETFLAEMVKDDSDADAIDTLVPTLSAWEGASLKHRLVIGRVVRNNGFVGYLLVVEYNKSIDEGRDFDPIKLLCQFCAVAMDSYNYSASGLSFVESFLKGILDKTYVTDEAIRERMSLFNMEFKKQMVVITVESMDTPRKLDRLNYLKTKLRKLFNRDTVVIHDNKVVVFYDEDSIERLMSGGRIETLSELMEETNFRASISSPFDCPGNLYDYYEHTVDCFLIAKRLKINDRVLKYSDYQTIHMILHFDSVLPIDKLIIPEIKLLQSVDKKRGTDMVKTLFCYLGHKQDVTATAKAMHVHYNTLKYRINKIAELTKLDMNDKNTLFNVLLSEKVLKLEEQFRHAQDL